MDISLIRPKKGSENRGALNLNGKDMEAFFISRIQGQHQPILK